MPDAPFSLTSIPNAIPVGERQSHPDWDVVADWIKTNVHEEQQDEIWTALARDWLDRLKQSLRGDYVVRESHKFLLLAKESAVRWERLLENCERARRTILETLVDVARDEFDGKHVLLAFADTESYYDYTADFDPDEGEFGLSAGMFIEHGYRHSAICLAYGNYDRIIAHELCHTMLRHLPLPVWLNEGVTQVIEDLVVGGSNFMVSPETAAHHRAYWNAETIDAFWSGESFISRDAQGFSYHLSQILFRNLMSDFPKQVSPFLNAANYRDAGNDALQQLCNVTLGSCVAQFLGDGPWEPKADYAPIEKQA